MSDIHRDHRQRRKEEFRKNGHTFENYPTHKILEFILFYSNPRGDTNVFGHGLQKQFGSLSSVFDAPYEALMEVEGIGPETATMIKAFLSLMGEYQKDKASPGGKLQNVQQMKDYVNAQLQGQNYESIIFVALGFNGRILVNKKIAEGTPDTVSIAPAVILRAAVNVDAVKVLLAHNHPNGLSIPSKADLATTKALYRELAKVNIEMVDHIIVAADGVCSMRESGMLDGIL